MEKINPKEHRERKQLKMLAITFAMAVFCQSTLVIADEKSSMFEVILALLIGVSSILYYIIYVKSKQ